MSWAFSHQSLVKKMTHRLAHKPTGGGEHFFFQLRFLFPASVELTKKSSTETNGDLNSGQLSLGLHIKPLRKRPAAATANPIKLCIIITSSQMLSWGLLTEDKHVDVLNGEAKDWTQAFYSQHLRSFWRSHLSSLPASWSTSAIY